METNRTTPAHEPGVWQDALVLVGTLFFGCFAVGLVIAICQDTPAGEALGGCLGYAIVATLTGLVPLATHAFFYSFCLRHHRIGYAGAAGLATSVVLVYAVIVQWASGGSWRHLLVLAVFGAMHAVPTALVAHAVIAKLRHTGLPAACVQR